MNKLSFEQMECINGGSWVGDALRGITDAIVSIAGWIFTRLSDFSWGIQAVGNGTYSTSSGDFSGSLYLGGIINFNY